MKGDGRRGEMRKSADSSDEVDEADGALSSSEPSSEPPAFSEAGEAATEADVWLAVGRVGEECRRMKEEARSSRPLSSNIDHMSAATKFDSDGGTEAVIVAVAIERRQRSWEGEWSGGAVDACGACCSLVVLFH